MPDAAADDIRRFAERELACRVAAISHRDERWWQEWRLALSAVRVAGENPTLMTLPARQIDVSGLWLSTIAGASGAVAKRARDVERLRPPVVESCDLQAMHVDYPIARPSRHGT
jgi:hypothetical protein